MKQVWRILTGLVLVFCASVYAQNSAVPGASLGVFLADVSDARAQDLKLGDLRGALVGKVVERSPAAAAGLKENDVITGFDSQSIQHASQIYMLLSETLPGSSVLLRVFRDGTDRDITVIVSERQDSGIDSATTASQYYASPRRQRVGLKAAALSDQLAKFFGVAGKPALLITEVEPRGIGDRAGLRAGDCLLSINGAAPSSASGLSDQINELINRKSDSKGERPDLLFEIVRGGKEQKLTFKLAAADN